MLFKIYIKKTAKDQGSQNYAKLRNEIEQELQRINDKTEASAEEAIKMCRDIAVVDSKDYKKKRISKGIELYGRTQSVFVDKHVVENKGTLRVEVVKFGEAPQETDKTTPEVEIKEERVEKLSI